MVDIFGNDTVSSVHTDDAIENLRSAVQHKVEFKFSKCRRDIRDRFFEEVRPFGFLIRAIVVDKSRLHSDYLRQRGNNLIQLADMTAGAIHRYYREDRTDRSRWFEMIQPRIADVWTFPNPGH